MTEVSQMPNSAVEQSSASSFQFEDRPSSLNAASLRPSDGSKSDQNTTKDKVGYKLTSNGDIQTPKKTLSKLQTPSKKNSPPSPMKTPLKSPSTPGTPGKISLPKTPENPAPPTVVPKKVPMNKIQVGAAPSPNLKTVKSKVGSLANTTHKPGGGNIKIETHKVDLTKVQPRTEAKNEQYKPSGGDKKIQQVKLQWSAQSKVGSLENATYKPGGGDKKIESVKLDFKEKAKPKVGSKDNVKHVPGGGNIKIENQKLEFKAQSKVGSLDNVKHKPGGGDIKIFDDKTYLRQVSGNSSEGRASGTQGHGDLMLNWEVEGGSASGTLGRKTSVKIKRTTIKTFEGGTNLKKITEVTVTSQTPKKEKLTEKSPTEVKVSYTKTSSSKKKSEEPVEFIKLPANLDAPILKPRLSNKDVFDGSEAGKQCFITSENTVDCNNSDLSTNVKYTGNLKKMPQSVNLSESKTNFMDDLNMSKFLRDEMATREKIGEIWREKNAVDPKANLSENKDQEVPKEFSQGFLPGNWKNNKQQFLSENPDSKTDTQGNGNHLKHSNSTYNQNLHSEQIPHRPSMIHKEQPNQQNPIYSSLEQDEGKLSSSHTKSALIKQPSDVA